MFFPQSNAILSQQLLVARQDRSAVHPGGDSLAGNHLELFRRGKGIWVVLSAAAENGLAQGMLRELLGGGSQSVELLLMPAGEGEYRNHLGRAPGQRAGLVKGDLGDCGQPLQRVPLTNQKAVLGGVADGGHNGGGSGQHQSTGAEHHQNGHRPDALPGDQPGQHRRSQGNDHNPGGPAVGQPNNFGLARVGGLHQTDHALDGAVLAHLHGLHLKGAELIDGAAGHQVAGPLVHRHGLSRHHRLVDGGFAGANDAVHRHRLSGQHPEAVTNLHLLGGDHRLALGGQDSGGLGGEADQLFNTRPSPGHGEILQQRAQLHDEGHLSGGKVLPDVHRGNESQGHQYIRLDVKGGDQTDEGLQEDRGSAQNDGYPGRIEGEGEQA